MTKDEGPSKSSYLTENLRQQYSKVIQCTEPGTRKPTPSCTQPHFAALSRASTRNKRRLSVHKLWATATVPGKPGFCLRAHPLLSCRFPRLTEIGRRFSTGFS